MNISSTISHEKAIRYLNAARAYACIISNCEKKVGIIILTKQLITVVINCNHEGYNVVESLFTDTCKLGGISLNDTICVITEFPCIKSMRLCFERSMIMPSGIIINVSNFVIFVDCMQRL